MNQTHDLYRHFDKDGVLLYVGISISAVYRLGGHRNASSWYSDIARVEIERHESRESALVAEKEAIQKELPKHNIQHKLVEKTDSREPKNTREFSELHLLTQIVTFKPVYTLQQAADTLDIGLTKLKRLIDGGEISYLDYGNRAGYPIRKISGWHLIDFLERVEAGEIDFSK